MDGSQPPPGITAGKPELELLAPAGDWLSLEAALEAGAKAVYFGLTSLNARRRAKNFEQDEFVLAVEKAHASGARAYLTLNVDLTERELGQAARALELARQAKADAVLVRDPALLLLRSHFPELEFHFSTQSCMTSSADVAAAGRLGASRAVLARELTLDEIAAASAVGGVETEVFAQGALCFCVSGRCLLASWVGGRSGNRGACTSPCRVPWSVGDQPAGTPLSMRDLAAVHRLDEIRRAGVKAVKIEGRLKTAQWVRRAVALYRRALDGNSADVESLLEEAAALGAYTGRAMTCAYLDGRREDLVGLSAGREAGAPAEDEDGDESAGAAEPPPETDAEASPSTGAAGVPAYDFEILVESRGIACRVRFRGRTDEWVIPKTIVRRAHKAIPVGALLDHLSAISIQDCRLGHAVTNDREFLLVPRAANAMVDRISSALRLAKKAPAELIRIELPAEVQAALEKRDRHPANQRMLGQSPDRARLEAAAAAAFLRRARPAAVIVEGLTAGKLDRVRAACGRASLIVALPPIFFEEEIAGLRNLVRQCAAEDLTVEVNSWGGWWLAREAGARMEGGPGLAVLNSLAARQLGQLGIESVTLSLEADRRQLEAAAACCPVPCSVVVFGRPPLMTTRVRLPEDQAEAVFIDRRGVRMSPRRERGLWVFRPQQPFDLRTTQNDRIRAAHLVVDLIGSDDPAGDWHDLPDRAPFRFNYDRSLA